MILQPQWTREDAALLDDHKVDIAEELFRLFYLQGLEELRHEVGLCWPDKCAITGEINETCPAFIKPWTIEERDAKLRRYPLLREVWW